jgi:hypothetical protein
MSSPEARLAFVVILLACQLIFFTIEFFWVIKNPHWYTWGLKRFQSIAILIAVLGFIFALVAWVSRGTAQTDINSKCTVSIDGDVGGIGVRIAFWVQESVIFVAAFTGIFHRKPTAAKEVGAGLLIMQTSFSIALLVQMAQHMLSPADAAIGLMILDALNMALSIQLFMKHPLASRWQVCTVLLSQSLGLVTIAILTARFNKGKFNAKDCKCFMFFWWAWLNSCSLVSSFEVPIFWIYYGFRCLNFVHNCFFSLKQTWDFDACDKLQSLQRYLKTQNGENLSKIRGGLEGMDGQVLDLTVLEQLEDSDKRFWGDNKVRQQLINYLLLWMDYNGDTLYWEDRLTTINLYFFTSAVFALTSMAAAESTLRDFRPNQSGQKFSIGQITALVIAGSTAIREVWVFGFMFLKARRRGND